MIYNKHCLIHNLIKSFFDINVSVKNNFVHSIASCVSISNLIIKKIQKNIIKSSREEFNNKMILLFFSLIIVS